MLNRIRQRRQQERKTPKPPRPIKDMSPDERAAYFAERRARVASIVARWTAANQSRSEPDTEVPDQRPETGPEAP